MYSALEWLGASVLGGEVAVSDVVVVRAADGVVRSSPWLVRVQTPQRRGETQVVVLLNGEDSGLRMRVGATGEAFFVQRLGSSRGGSSRGGKAQATSKRMRSFSEGFLEPEEEEEEEEGAPRRARSFDRSPERQGADGWDWAWGDTPLPAPPCDSPVSLGATLTFLEETRNGVAFPDQLWEDGERTDNDEASLGDIPLEQICPELLDADESDCESLRTDGSRRQYRFRRALVPGPRELRALRLVEGENRLEFALAGTVLRARLFLWGERVRLVAADADALAEAAGWGLGQGQGRAPSAAAALKSAELLSRAHAQGYRVLYLASRGQRLRGTGLPPGPVLRPPESLVRALGSERTELLRAAALRTLRTLFDRPPLHASLSAGAADAAALAAEGVPEGRAFVLTALGLRAHGRTYVRPFADLQPLFPPVPSHGADCEAFSDFSFWRTPYAAIDP